MLPELGVVSAAAHDFEWWVSDEDAFGRRCRWSCARKRCSSLLMRSEMRQCFVANSSERVVVVILLSGSVDAGCCGSNYGTVGMLEMVLWLHTHGLWNAKTSGVGRNVGIIVDRTEG